jgi:hypothetical protein
MDQAKAIINLNEGIIELEGPVEFVRHYLEMYAPAVKRPLPASSQTAVSGVAKKARGRRKGSQRSCTRAIRGEIKAGFFDEARSTQVIRERLAERGVVCSTGVLRSGLKKAVADGRLVTAGRRRGLVYSKKAETS